MARASRKLSSRGQRRRAAVRSAKRTRNNNWWYGLTAIVVIAGVALIVYTRLTAPADVGPLVMSEGTDVKDSHWHAALGVYSCDHWVGDGTGDGVWTWPSEAAGQPGFYRDGTEVYAGLHSHRDGVIHMEPAVSEDAGKHATVGKYFDYGGWDVSADGYDFVDGKPLTNGDACPTGGNGTMQWAVAKWDGAASTDTPLQFEVKQGNPAVYKLNQGDVVIIAFLPPGKSITDLNGDGKGSNPPGFTNLPSALGAEEQGMPAPQQTPPATTPATGSTPGSTPGSGSSPGPGSTAPGTIDTTPTSGP
jgi:hypothetical protein